MAEINPVTAELAAQINDLANQGLTLLGLTAATLESEGGVGFMLNYNLVAANEVPVRDPGSATGLY